jgi:hypothetical protein
MEFQCLVVDRTLAAHGFWGFFHQQSWDDSMNPLNVMSWISITVSDCDSEYRAINFQGTDP